MAALAHMLLSISSRLNIEDNNVNGCFSTAHYVTFLFVLSQFTSILYFNCKIVYVVFVNNYKCKLKNSWQHCTYCYINVISFEQGSKLFFNGPDDNVNLWSPARFEQNIIERLCNFTDLNIERI